MCSFLPELFTFYMLYQNVPVDKSRSVLYSVYGICLGWQQAHVLHVCTLTRTHTRTRTWVHVHFHVFRKMLALSSWLSYGYLNFILFTVILKAFHEKAPACLRSQPQKLCFVSFITLLITLLCLRSSFMTLLSSVSISTLPLRPYSATFVGKASNEIIFTRSKIEKQSIQKIFRKHYQNLFPKFLTMHPREWRSAI